MARKKIAFGSWIFLAFLVLTLLGSVVDMVPLWLAIVFAIPVAIFNITEKETLKTLVAALVLAVGGGLLIGFNQIPYVGTYLGSVMTNLGAYLGVVGVIVAIKEMIFRSRD